MIGKTLAHYEITALLGKGGMGEVYRARDTRLGREVALKVIAHDRSGDPEREARLAREARTLASLQHANIASIYGFESIDDVQFLVMELVEGEDLEQRLRAGRLATDEALDVACQIATGLEVAHEQGIVHRDLKPANVKIAPDGQVKILDFGLARAVLGEVADADPATSPTITAGMTAAGTILGTAAYMSPEQARGRTVDRRADIWAFGCVLFEMLTGRRAFGGETVSDTLASLLTRTPEWNALPGDVPPRLRELVQRCLTKDARQRLRDIGEARVLLESVDADGPVTPVGQRSSSNTAIRFVLLAVAGLVLFGAGYALRSADSTTSTDTIDPDVRVRRLTYAPGLEHEPTLSPDGNYVAYTTDAEDNLDITVLPLAGGNPTRVVDHPADDAHPAWSPDGTRLAFVSARDRGGSLNVVGGLGALSRLVHGLGGDIFLIPALGGTPTKLVDQAMYPTWSPDGSEIAFQAIRDGRSNIWAIPADGGEPRALTHDDTIDFQPAWSPDGEWVAFCSLGPTGLLAVPATGGDPLVLVEGRVTSPAWSPDGEWIYFSSDRASVAGYMSLWRIPFRPHEPPIVRPQRVTVGAGSAIGVDVSADGTRLVYTEMVDAPDIWSWDPVTGAVERVAALDGAEDFPSLSPDGRRLAFASDRGGTERIWTLDMESGVLEQMHTTGPAVGPRWSPDGDRLLYMADSGAGQDVAVRRWGEVKGRTIAPDVAAAAGAEWSPDGTRIAFGSAGLVVTDLAGEQRRILDGDGAFPTWSPDGSTIAYQKSLPDGAREVWAVAAEGGAPWRIAGGDVEYSHPQWSPTDPDRILVVVDHQEVAVIRVSTGEVETTTTIGSTRVLVDYPCWSFDGRKAYFSLSRATGDVYSIEGP